MLEIKRALGKLRGSIFGRAEVDVRRDAGCLAITFGDLLGEILRAFFANQIDRAPAETTPGHASPAKTRQAFGCINHDVEFPAAHFVEISQAVVRLAHQVLHPIQIDLFQRASSVQRPLVLADNVGTAFCNGGGKVMSVLITKALFTFVKVNFRLA